MLMCHWTACTNLTVQVSSPGLNRWLQRNVDKYFSKQKIDNSKHRQATTFNVFHMQLQNHEVQRLISGNYSMSTLVKLLEDKILLSLSSAMRIFPQ